MIDDLKSGKGSTDSIASEKNPEMDKATLVVVNPAGLINIPSVYQVHVPIQTFANKV